MEEVRRTQLKGYFKAGRIPLESHFGTLIDKTWNREDDGIYRDLDSNGKAVGPLKIHPGLEKGRAESLLAFYSSENVNTPHWKIELPEPQKTAGKTIRQFQIKAEDGEGFFSLEVMEPNSPDGSRGAKKKLSLHGALLAEDFALKHFFLTQKLQASDLPDNPEIAGDRFGYGIAIYKDMLAISAPEDEGGSVYIYRKSAAETWSCTENLRAGDFDPDTEESGDWFGHALALHEDTLVIGSYWDEGQAGTAGTGCAYIYYKDINGNWEKKKLQTSDFGPDIEDAGDQFGRSVAVYEDTIIIGAPQNEGLNGLAGVGIVYIYQRDENGAWQPSDIKLRATDFAEVTEVTAESFGIDVAIYKDTIAIGANNDNEGAGSAYTYQRDANGVWQPGEKKLSATDFDPDMEVAEDKFGTWVAIHEETIVIGAHEDEALTGVPDAGSAYVYQRDNNGVWLPTKILRASDFPANPVVGAEYFGRSIAFNENVLLVGAHVDEGPAGESQAGSVYIYQKDKNGDWKPAKKLQANDFPRNPGIRNDRFGYPVAIYQDTIVIGSYEDKGSAGSAYIGSRNVSEIIRSLTKLT